MLESNIRCNFLFAGTVGVLRYLTLLAYRHFSNSSLFFLCVSFIALACIGLEAL